MQNETSPIIKLKPWWLRLAWWARYSNITFYPYIFSVKDGPLSSDSYVHEMVHWGQQKRSRSRIIWYLKYAVFPNFRLQIELEAFKEQIRFWVLNDKWGHLISIWLEQELSGWTYFKMISKVEAHQWIANTVQEVSDEALKGSGRKI